jgi:type IV pilus assembly protein PilA
VFVNGVPFHLLEEIMKKFGQMKLRELGQGMTEYIIIVALMAVGAVGVYKAFGDVVRGQATSAATVLAGSDSKQGRTIADGGATDAAAAAKKKGLKDFEAN